MRLFWIMLGMLCSLATVSTGRAAEGNVVRVWTVTGVTPDLTETDDLILDDDTRPNAWTNVRFYVAGGSAYVFMLKRQTGEAQIRSATGAAIGNVVNTYDVGDDWTSVDTYVSGATMYLLLHRSRTGEVDRYVLTAAGGLGTRTGYGAIAALRDKSDFSAYNRGGSWFWSATDRWTGRANFFTSAGGDVSNTTWSLGWASVDYVRIMNTTYRLMFKPLATPGNQPGRLVSHTVAANGNSAGNLSEHAQLSNPEWTHIRFVTSWSAGVPTTRVFFYAAKTGEWSINSFSTGSGIGSSVNDGVIEPNMADIDVYAHGNVGYIQGVVESDDPILNNAQLDNIGGGGDGTVSPGSSINGQVIASGRPGGWQSAFMQSGRLMLKASGGMINQSAGIAVDDTAHPFNWGSVTKLLTAIALVKLADRGEIDIDAPVEVYLDPGQYDPTTMQADVFFLTTREILEYRSGLDRRNDFVCSADNTNVWAGAEMLDGRDCLGCLEDPANPDGSKVCPRGYTNSVWNMGRDIIGWTAGWRVPPTNDITANDTLVITQLVPYLRTLWWTRAGAGPMTCSPDPATHGSTLLTSQQLYYSRLTTCGTPATPGNPPTGQGFSPSRCTGPMGFPGWVESIFSNEGDIIAAPPGFQGPWVCSTGGIQARAEEMSRALQGLRGNRILTPDWEKYITNASPNAPPTPPASNPCPGAPPATSYTAGWFETWSWTDPLDPMATCQTMLGKNGSTSDRSEAQVERLYYGADAAVVLNSDANTMVSSLIPNAWTNMGL